MSEKAINILARDLMSVQDAAKLLGRPRVTIYRWIDSGKILSVRLGGVIFIPLSEVERLKTAKGIKRAEVTNDQAVEQLRASLTGTRQKAPASVAGYTQTARAFLTWVGKGGTFTPQDVDRYFAQRRKDGISERTMGTEFDRLEKLAQVLGVPWPFTKDDRPRTEERKRLIWPRK